jgi:hypothetical protein
MSSSVAIVPKSTLEIAGEMVSFAYSLSSDTRLLWCALQVAQQSIQADQDAAARQSRP